MKKKVVCKVCKTKFNLDLERCPECGCFYACDSEIEFNHTYENLKKAKYNYDNDNASEIYGNCMEEENEEDDFLDEEGENEEEIQQKNINKQRVAGMLTFASICLSIFGLFMQYCDKNHDSYDQPQKLKIISSTPLPVIQMEDNNDEIDGNKSDDNKKSGKKSKKDSKLTKAQYKKLCERKDFDDLFYSDGDYVGKKIKVDVKAWGYDVSGSYIKEDYASYYSLNCDVLREHMSLISEGWVELEFDDDTIDLKQEIINRKYSTIYGVATTWNPNFNTVTIKVKYAEKLKKG